MIPQVLDRRRVVNGGVERDDPGTLHRVRQQRPAGVVAEFEHWKCGLEGHPQRGQPASCHGSERAVREGDVLAGGNEGAVSGLVECGDDDVGGYLALSTHCIAPRGQAEAPAPQDVTHDLVALTEIRVVWDRGWLQG